MLKGTLWNKDASDVWCPHSSKSQSPSKNNQLVCQNLCETHTKLNCVGIVVSAKHPWCYLCKNDTIKTSGNGEGFYRRPGIFSIFLH